MSDPGRPQSPKKLGEAGKGRLGTLKSGFLDPSVRQAGLRIGGGDGSAARPIVIKTEEAASNGQVFGRQAAATKMPAKKKFAPNIKAALARGSAAAAAVKPQPATEAAAGPSGAAQQQPLSEEHAALLRQAELDAQWARGGKKGQHVSAGRPKQPGIRVAVAPKAARAPNRDPRAPAAAATAPAAVPKGKAGTATASSRGKVKKEAPEEEPAFMEDGGYNEDEGDEGDERGSARRSMFDMRQYYPTRLPLRHPGSAPDPADEEEGGMAGPSVLDAMPDNAMNVAERLGLLGVADDDSERRCVLVQLPLLLPATHPPDGGGGGTGGAGGGPSGGKGKARREGALHATAGHGACSLRDLPSGKIGRLLVYESGAVRLALGDVLLEVQAGTEAELRQDVALIDADAGSCVFLHKGGVHARAIACPDMDHLLGDAPVPKDPRGKQRKKAEKLTQVLLDSDEDMQDAEEVLVKDENE